MNWLAETRYTADVCGAAVPAARRLVMRPSRLHGVLWCGRPGCMVQAGRPHHNITQARRPHHQLPLDSRYDPHPIYCEKAINQGLVQGFQVG